MTRGLIPVLLLAGACSSGGLDPHFWIPSERQARVREAAEAYAADLRWGRIEQAAARVQPDGREAFRATLAGLAETLRFTRSEVESVGFPSGPGEAHVRVIFELYRPPSLEEQGIVEHQVWRYDPEDRAWYVEPDLGLYRGGAEGR